MSLPWNFHNKRPQNTVELVGDVIQRLFPVNKMICTGIEYYLYYGKSPWGIRFRIKERGIRQLIKQDPWGPQTVVLTVIKDLGLQRCPSLRRTNSSCREDSGSSPGIPIGHPSSEPPKTGGSGSLCHEGPEASLPLLYLSLTAGSQTCTGQLFTRNYN